MRRKGRETQFKALLYPAGNYICIAFLAMILVLMWHHRRHAFVRHVAAGCGWSSCLWRSSCHVKSDAYFSLSLWERVGVRASDRT
ncbi:phenylalanine transporter [Enterobacter cancerogenus]|uniref:Phenylalanine transporter n=1 Tax=Enterobacter cancerogenus TaxID=69218 RepID=A0A484XHT4_9ENTR|nr:phenylalanine transporter [Enterobacter cancerogenus]